MSEIKKSVIRFESSNHKDTVAGYYFVCPDVKPKAILQISHGMCEYIGRYENFAEYMAKRGYIVCGNDHLGHGATSDGPNGIDGYFGDQNGRSFILKDLYHMNCLARKAYPELPVILLGHSMGSFFARWYATVYPETLKALVISGTGGPNPLAGLGIALSGLVCRLKGTKVRSDFLQNLAFGQYLKKIDHPATSSDWITRDAEIVARYVKDPKCTFIFTASAFREMLSVLRDVSRSEWAQKMNRNLPVALFSGDADPVGDYGKGVRKVFEMLQNAGVKDVSLKLYPGARHEVLNEINRDTVYRDIGEWCDDHI